MIRVVTSSQSAARDTSAISAGIASRALMHRAGAAAAAEIALRCRDRLDAGVLVAAGPGNNGGDAWVVARALAAVGVRVRVAEPVAARSADCIAERSLALESGGPLVLADVGARIDDVGDGLVVDGLLGTGARAAPRGEIAAAVNVIEQMRARGAFVIALDLPTGLDASTGRVETPCVHANLSITFGTVKRGHVVARDVCGDIVIVDIGLGKHAELPDGAPMLVDEGWVASQIPRTAADAHKGTRRKLAIIGGAPGLAGASILAARGALRSGIGMARIVVAPDSLRAVQEAEPYAMAAAWPSDDAHLERDVIAWADAVVIGPGLGRGDESRALLERVLTAWKGPTLLDADALTLFENDLPRLARLLGGRASLITPHYAEFARLTGSTVDAVAASRFECGIDVARTLGGAVLLKGVPTVITASSGERMVSATGTPALATAGSGDVLSGIAGTILAQLGDGFRAGAAAAWVHGRAAERVPTTGETRGITLEDIVAELRDSWVFDARPGRYPVLGELPAVSA